VDEVFRRAVADLQLGKLRDAERSFRKLLSKHPRHLAALNLLAVVLTQLGEFTDAERCIRRALKEGGASDATFYNHGIILKALRRPEEAYEQLTRATEINPNLADTWNNRGTVLNDLARYQEAIADFDRAIALSPNHPGAHYNRGKSLAQLKRYDEALESYGRALASKPDLAEAWLGCGNVFTEMRRYEEAYAACDRAVTLNPELKFALGARLQSKLQLCDWADLASDIERFAAATRERKLPSIPFSLLTSVSSPKDQLIGTARYVEEQPTFPPIWRGERYDHGRLRVAYLSPDFADHPVAQQIVGLLEHHDRSRFEITGISFGPRSESELSRRVRSSFDRFVDVRAQPDADVAAQIRAFEIDIAVDLCGFTQGCRPNILARRPAPVQASYLGYAGTMGSPHIDYVIADPTVIPKSDLQFYAENVVWLPETFMVNDPKREISEWRLTRQECGLPAAGFVFCCFNSAYKICPEVFAVWMRLLRAVGNSVLWLAQSNPAAMGNLRREAEKSKVAPERVIFAPRLPEMANYLARLRLADLFLDTLPYNGHVTASDALWAGLPVLTCLGGTFAGRVAASQLNAVGLPELVTDSLASYETLALKLASDEPMLRDLKERLAAARRSAPLFDARRFARHVEAAYNSMSEGYRRGARPRNLLVDRLP
jgi:predicted O-linked N-acetylglucosamine transferase (SPINDLY family)